MVLVDPVSQHETYKDIVDIVMGTYDTMQRKILEGDMRAVYVESLAKRARNRLAPDAREKLQSSSTVLETFFRLHSPARGPPGGSLRVRGPTETRCNVRDG